ncbi:hypothetical protein AGDE_13346 [Angomonas deanei]|uniref:Uncharacterized protein n=1 Tax=Angomonas deanei TaxID=59799 RepID=A0A7G2CEI5_9TRYP|nr:hypothetical protein AGDE_13346 [Angomonas deanei]CAD2218280.1 hypothetical protein, conserved [Angomonas deanei]|eukprot:EPY22459.1 hypothetical protein AGDE_13346 [Angomonas deanei]
MCPYVGDTDVIYTPSPEGAGSADVCTYTCKDPYLSPVGGGCLPRVGEYYDSVAGIYAVCQLPDAITEGARITYVAGGVRDAPGSCPFVSAWRVWSGELTTLPTALNVSTGDSRTWEATIALDHSRVLRALGDAESVSGDPSAAFLLASVESGSGLQYAWYLTARQDAGDTSTVWFALVLNISHLSALVESSYIVSEEWQRAAAPDGNGGDKYTLVLSLCWSTQGSVTFFVDHKRVSPITPVFLLPSTVFPTPLFIKLGGWIALYHEQSQITINGFAIPRYFDMLPGFLTAFRAYKYYKEDFMGTLVAASQMEVPGDPTAVSLQILGMLIDYFPISVSELAALSARLQRIAASTFKSLSSSCRPGTGNSGIECPDCGTAFYSLTDRTAGTSTCTCIPQRQLSPDAPICVRREVGYPAPKMLSVGSSFTVPTSFSGSTETMMAVWRIDRDDGPSSTTSLAVEATMECTVGLIHLREIPGQTLYQYYARNAVGVGPDLCTTTCRRQEPSLYGQSCRQLHF